MVMSVGWLVACQVVFFPEEEISLKWWPPWKLTYPLKIDFWNWRWIIFKWFLCDHSFIFGGSSHQHQVLADDWWKWNMEGNLCGQKSCCQWCNMIRSSQNDLPSDPWTFASVSLFNSSKIVGLVAYSSTKGHSNTTYNWYVIYIYIYYLYAINTKFFQNSEKSHGFTLSSSTWNHLCQAFFDPGYHRRCFMW